MKKLLLLITPLLFGGVAHADDNDFSIFGGGMTCQDMEHALISTNSSEVGTMKVVITYYMGGFWSSYNVLSYINSGEKKPSHIGDGIKTDFMADYTREYCLHHPKSSLPEVASELTRELGNR